ncbi:MAG: hypothetical protein JO257_10710 [Deltaproteobacteria bacterium]|nr:hypothetical protein [Deltaproteobacteria bacterium]
MKTALALLLLASTASADPAAHEVVRVRELVPTCVVIDAEHDALLPDERPIAARTLARVLEQADVLVVETGCADTYTVRHERAPDGLIVHVTSPRGARRLHAANVGALGAAYRDAVNSLYAATDAPAMRRDVPAAAPANATDTAAVASVPAAAPSSLTEGLVALPADGAPSQVPVVDTFAEPAPAVDLGKRVPGAGGVMWYGSLGFAPVLNGDTATSFGVGLRFEQSASLLELGADLYSSGDGSQPVRGQRLNARLMKVLSPDSSISPYVGGGLAIGNATITGQYATYSGSGIETDAAFGMDFARDHRGVRLFAELALVAPLYALTQTETGASQWSPSALFRVGLGK